MVSIILLGQLLLRVRSLRLSSCLIITPITLILLLIEVSSISRSVSLSVLLSIILLDATVNFLCLIVLRFLSATTVSLRISVVTQRCSFLATRLLFQFLLELRMVVLFIAKVVVCLKLIMSLRGLTTVVINESTLIRGHFLIVLCLLFLLVFSLLILLTVRLNLLHLL